MAPSTITENGRQFHNVLRRWSMCSAIAPNRASSSAIARYGEKQQKPTQADSQCRFPEEQGVHVNARTPFNLPEQPNPFFPPPLARRASTSQAFSYSGGRPFPAEGRARLHSAGGAPFACSTVGRLAPLKARRPPLLWRASSLMPKRQFSAGRLRICSHPTGDGGEDRFARRTSATREAVSGPTRRTRRGRR